MLPERQWQKAISWVKSNRILVEKISAPYLRFMASNLKDVEQEAILAAFYVLDILADQDQNGSQFGAYFRVQFRARCIKMATGGMKGSLDDPDQIPSDPSEQTFDQPDQEIMEQALQKMSRRQRQISRWILAQPTPVSTSCTAKVFGVTDRAVRILLCNAVQRLENDRHGNTQLRKGIPAAA